MQYNPMDTLDPKLICKVSSFRGELIESWDLVKCLKFTLNYLNSLLILNVPTTLLTANLQVPMSTENEDSGLPESSELHTSELARSE